MQDFFFSFRFSQGIASAQRAAFGLLAAEYDNMGIEREQISRVIEHIGSAATNLHLPRTHIEVGEELVTKEFRDRWAEFNERLTVRRPHWPAAVHRSHLIRAMVGRDEYYLDNYQYPIGRRTTRHTDRWESQTREYVLNGRRTGSDAFDAIFSRMRASTLRSGLPVRVSTLRGAWERRHDGERFFPPEYEAELMQLGSSWARRRSLIRPWVGRLLLSYE